MAVKVPVISVNCPGPNEVLEFGKYGMLVNNNEDSLYDGIRNLVANKEICNSYRNKAIERGRMFSIRRFIEEVDDILNTN